MKEGLVSLRSIEIAGFKSFAKRTTIEFDKGLVAIVGPNGSGKSNIADAIRWVFGEQKNKSLRTDKSEDLIYHGGDKNVSASMAEVIISLDNSSGKIPIEYGEIEITRRLYRSGENSYLLNGRKTSLSSIQELLSKAGFGVGSYTVIGQGMIDRLILASGEERKKLFEEASGIKQYEIKISQTSKKVESASQNLNQIVSLIDELRPEYDSLVRQQSVLQKRTALEDELNAKKVSYIIQNTDQAKKQINTIKSDINQLTAELQKHQRAMEKLESDKPGPNISSKANASQIESQLAKLDSERVVLEGQINTVSGEISSLTNSADTDLLKQKLVGDIRDTKKSISSHIATQAKLKKEIRSYDKKIRAVEEKISLQTRALESTRRSLSKSQKTEYLRHSLGLIDILQDSIKKDRPKAELGIIFYKLRRMLMHSIKDNSAELALNVGRIQNTISSLLGEKEKVTESQTSLIIRLRALEMDTHSLKEHLGDLDVELSEIKSAQGLGQSKKLTGLRKKLAAMEIAKDKIIKQAERDRGLLVEIASQGENDSINEYYDRHETISNEIIKTSQQIEQLSSTLADSEKNQSYFDALRNQWFGTKMPAIEVQKGPVELSEIDRLSAELELMKQINPEVEKASNEINARMNFLTKQEQDLKKAIEDLEKIIHRSQSQMQKSFAKSFERINKNFSNSFVGLFGGGKARLSLLSSGGGFGVEIDVQLPGKKSQNLSSLSGGEKALASVALLAAILRSNPSPFVVLDEVDAALDEENTKKFATVIADITRHSQVLVITHNHETMSAATELIGITTSGSNNSHVIKVKLDNLPVTATK